MAPSEIAEAAKRFVSAATQPAVAGALGRDSHVLGGARLSTREADHRLAAIIRSYRAGDRATWAPVLLEAMAPMLIPRLARINGEPPYLRREDVAQQLALEVLEEALIIDLDANPRLVAKRLMWEGVRRVTAQLKAEAALRLICEPLPEDGDDDEEG